MRTVTLELSHEELRLMRRALTTAVNVSNTNAGKHRDRSVRDLYQREVNSFRALRQKIERAARKPDLFGKLMAEHFPATRNPQPGHRINLDE